MKIRWCLQRQSRDNHSATALQSLGRSLVVWSLIIVAETLHGMLRALLLVPAVGEFRSDQIGVFSGSIIILLIAQLTIGWIGTRPTLLLLIIGSLWLVLTVCFELLLGRGVMGMSWEAILAGYDITRGGLMPFGLAVLFFSPLLAARFRGATMTAPKLQE